MLYLIAACSYFDEPATNDAELGGAMGAGADAAAELSVTPPIGLPSEIPADLPLGVREVQTPPDISRIVERRVETPNRQLDIRVNFDHGDYSAMAAALSRWGFTLRDADGETARVMAPAGERWAERLEVLPEFARVSETLSQDRLRATAVSGAAVPGSAVPGAAASGGAVSGDAESGGALRGGTTRFNGGILHEWSVIEGGLVEKIEGTALPGKPEIPRVLPAAVVRCLAPLRTAILDGEPAGAGWERALRVQPPAWAVVVEHFGACDATGWFVLEPVAVVDNLTIAGQPVKAVTDEQIFQVAQSYLSVPRARVDDSAVAACDLLRRADDIRLAAAIQAVVPGPHQERLLLALAERNEAAAISLARTSTSPTVRAWGAGIDDQVRDSVLADAAAPAEALLAAMTVWRPGAGDQGRINSFIRHAHPAVRMRAWELKSEVENSSCLGRLSTAKALDLAGAQALYAECPQQPVRLQAFARLVLLDQAVAATVVNNTLERPETVRAGISAVRAAHSMQRDNLLEAVVANPLGDRDVRAEALRTLLRAGPSANAQALFDAHGPFLGVRTAPGKAVAGQK